MDANAPQRGFLQIVNWHKAQKYQKINPPWVKLYTSLLSDDGEDARWQARQRWASLGPAGQALLVNLWLYAATTTTDGRIWWDAELMREVLPYTGPLDLGPLLAAGFVAWSKVKSEKPEAEGEGEAEAEAEGEPQAGAAASGPSPARAKNGTAASSAAEGQEPEGQAQNEGQVQSQGPSPAHAQRDGRTVPVIGNRSPPAGIAAAPLLPPVSDAPGGEVPSRPLAGQSPVGSPGDGGIPAALLGTWVARTVDPLRDAWVEQVFRGLHYPFAAESPAGRREQGVLRRLYERLWEEPLSRALSEHQRQTILAHDLKSAREKGRLRGHRNVGKVFLKIHRERLYGCLDRMGRDDIIRELERDRKAAPQHEQQQAKDWWNKP
jgi:hypothetical protein